MPLSHFSFANAAMTLALFFGLTAAGRGETPPALPDMELILELVVNGRPTGQIVPVKFLNGHYYLNASALTEAGLPVDGSGGDEVAVDALANVHVDYDSAAQQLLIDVPNEWLPNQRLISASNQQMLNAGSSAGFLMNYDLYATQYGGDERQRAVSLYSEQRAFSGAGILSNRGIYRYVSQSNGGNAHRYLRYDTYWRYSDERTMITYTAGDLITRPLVWANAVRLGGIQIERNFSTQPNLITYPLPQFAGQAAVPSAVDLYVNGYKTSRSEVNPGPFVIYEAPYVNGAGEATVVLTDALGRQVSTSIPFYVASNLLKQGLSDFSLSVGALRESYALNSFDYGDLVAAGNVRYGLTDWLTLGLHGESAPKLAVGGAGADLRLGRFGVINGSYSVDRAKSGARSWQTDQRLSRVSDSAARRGDQKAFGYSYTHRAFSVNAERIIRDDGYLDLAGYKSRYRLNRRNDRLTASVSVGRAGTIGAGYFDVRQRDGERLRLVNFSYSVPLWRSASLYASMNREIGASGYSGQLLVNIPLGDLHNASFSAQRSTENSWLYTGAYSRSVPVGGGVGWDVAYSEGRRENGYLQGALTWRTDHTQMQAGIYGRRRHTYWFGQTGSLVALNGEYYATNMINDAFVLVSTDGYGDVPVRFENQVVGKTNKNGYLLIPTVASYYPASYEIDTLDFPADVQAPQVRRRASVHQGSGYIVRFPVSKVAAVTTRLLDENGQPLPVGSLVRLNDGQTAQYVGWDGELYLENVMRNNALFAVRAGDGRRCRAAFSLEVPNRVQSLPALTCKEDKHHE